jgi:uncharacterized protein YndB with AHSA1/START domain
MSHAEAIRSEQKIFSTRSFNAPRELVWQAWTDPEKITHWWGPDGFTTTIDKMDFRVGGEWLFTMHGPDDTDYPNHQTFLEITVPERIVMAHNGPPKHTMTITFEADGDGTRLTMLHVFDSPSDYDLAVNTHHAVEGAIQHLARLDEFLASAEQS